MRIMYPIDRIMTYHKFTTKCLSLKHSKVALIVLVLSLLVLSAPMAFYSCDVLNSPNVILSSIDDLRADHLGCYGYNRNTSPNIDFFSKRSILFKRSYVHEPWTLPSHISMLTSLYPITHGVDRRHSLDPVIVTLAEALKVKAMWPWVL
jgi:hypothetical protein